MKADYTTTYLALLDILGFQDLVDKNSHQDLSSIYDNHIRSAVDGCLCHGKVDMIGARAQLRPSEVCLNSLMISDSVLLWTNDDTNASFEELVSVTRALLDSTFRSGLPMRGAISHGPLSCRTAVLA